MTVEPSPTFLADPNGSVLVAAVQWLQGTLLGTVATTIAVIAVASVGLMMLSGRVSLRRAGEVILGCFILFGASAIAAGIQSAAGSADDAAPDPMPVPLVVTPPAPPPVVVPPPTIFVDPTGGVAVPDKR
jgi:type IV secretory pathway VirB2 component (pilin)